VRQYAPYYDSATSKYKVIQMDDDGYWFNFIEDAISIENAKEVSRVLNEAELARYTTN
jgi:hypothetical protein